MARAGSHSGLPDFGRPSAFSVTTVVAFYKGILKSPLGSVYGGERVVGCWQVFPDSESWPVDRRGQAWEEGACAGDGGRTTGFTLLPLCLADKSPPSLVPTCRPTPPLRCWTVAICLHQALGSVPCPSWLTCLQMGSSGTVWAGRRAIPGVGT